MPLSIAALNHVYAGHASVAPWDVARQVFVAQLLPLGLGMALRQAAAPFAARLEPRLARIGNALLVATVAIVLLDGWEGTVTAGFRVLSAVALITGAALAISHLLGGPEPATRTAVAITSAARNPGLALLVGAVNAAPPAINAAILAYLVVSVLAIVPYVAWRSRVGARTPRAG
jgi:BASS family bile acid:Na+ symporter